MKENKPALPLLDFFKGKFAYRLQRSQIKNELLAKAVGIKGSYKPSVIDTTAGLGRDGFLLAYLGCSVLMIERNPQVYSQLEKALQQIEQDPTLQQKLQLKILNANSIDFLTQLDENDYPDVIYIDPMYPPRQKSALVKKEMRLLKDIVGEDSDAPQLLAIALQRAKKRIVVKRPRLAASLGNQKASYCLTGKTQRFDVYNAKGQVSAP